MELWGLGKRRRPWMGWIDPCKEFSVLFSLEVVARFSRETSSCLGWFWEKGEDEGLGGS